MTPAMFHDPTAPVQPDQYQVEFDALLDLYRNLQPRRVLEIGVREGGTLYQWMKNTPPGAVIVAVDLPGARWGNPEPSTCNPAMWREWAWEFGHEFHFIWGDSHSEEVKEQVRALGPYDFAFIDGDHSAAGVLDDLNTALSWDYVFRGKIALHDILPNVDDPTIQVHLIWNFLETMGMYYSRTVLTSEPDQTSRGIGVIHV